MSGLFWLVVPAGSAPAFHGYRPRALLLDEGTVMVAMVRLAGDDPAASHMSRERSADKLKTRELVGVENYDISTFGL